MKKVWVLGSQGLVGSQICQDLKSKSISFIATSHSQLDALDQSALQAFFEQHHPTHIINTVAHVRVDAAEGVEKDLCYDLNATVVEFLAKLCVKNEVKLIHISTDYVFDGRKNGPYEVDDPVNPINVYGKSKLEGERRLFEILPHACCIRTASVYGQTKPGLISGMLGALKTKQEVGHICDQTSSPTNAKDLSLAIISMLDQQGLFQFVNEGSCSRFELLEFIFNYCSDNNITIACKKLKSVTQKQSNRPATRAVQSVLSNAKIAPLLPFKIRTWQEALFEYLSTTALNQMTDYTRK